MKAFFKDLYNYNHYVNQQLIEYFSSNRDKISDRAMLLMNHILNANHIWNHRVLKQTSKYQVWDVNPLTELKLIDNANFKMSQDIINNSDLDETITYTNSKGDTYPNKVREILFHVINHGTHHRAQISSDVKTSGLTPLVTDYIAFKR